MRTALLPICICVFAVSAPMAMAGPPGDSSQSEQPAQATPPTETPAPQSQGTAPSTAAPAKTAPTEIKLKAADDEAAAEIRRLKAAGYHPSMSKGELIFCRSEPELGSRFEKKHCGTVAQLTAEANQGQDATEHAQHVAPQLPRGH